MIDQGRAFAPVYERIYPPGEPTARFCAARHPGGGHPSLELGAGTGRVALPLAGHVGEVIAVELAPEMVEQLRAAPKPSQGEVSPVEADMTTYEPDRTFGLVLCVCSTIGLVHDRGVQQRLVATWARALAPGGALVIENHNPAAIEELHEGRTRQTAIFPYPQPNRSLLTHGVLDRDNELWTATHVFFDQGTPWTATEVVRLTGPDRVDAYAKQAGLECVERYADVEGSPFTGNEPMFVSVYQHA
ncbi:class I SAM-dependent methyltransferase [Lipingzhangella sp. LS1_29]|uniref:Class I SAM-dependent methyltransferase n=1 Tax=Lipingzhangella rawalii TaxID=2055835 RepID=A0ABU2HAH1_9ACTN|nr:class I SAM-dependent methyltransferase [Lipingzhangella rawalii]MDS1272266.1 class I SAM-dependent methyltransferase [Lipingzhangella rawalii]